MYCRATLLIFLVTTTLSYRFCLFNNSQTHRQQPPSMDFQNQLLSYHPQYLHSFSYPQPSTIHVYYGRVEFLKPIFLIKQGFQSIQKEIFIVNNKNRYLTSAHKNTHAEYSKFMFVISIQDSYESNYTEKARLSIRKQKHIYSISMVNGTEYKTYILYFTHDQQKAINVSIGISDISEDPKNNWRLSRKIAWKNQNAELDIYNSSAILLQIDLRGEKNIQVHFKQVYIQKTNKQIHDEIAFLYDRYYYSRKTTNIKQTCSQAAYNRLIQGLSYQYGDLQVVDGSKKIHNNYKQLLSFSPSRKRFPWGFLWDDGFHNEVAVRKDKQLSFKVIQSWLQTIIDGWIPREQNRGKERQQLCNCAPFMAKDLRDGNPPTLVLPIQYIIRKKLFSPERTKVIWPKLTQWYRWFMRTQMTDKQSFLFKWFDHISGQGSFNSGLDDFPRPSNTKYHIDSQSWMYLMSRVMMQVGKYINQSTSQYQTNSQKIKENLYKFIEPSTSTLRDVGSGFMSTSYSTEVGYPSLLPLAFGMLEIDSKEFNATINLITNRSLLNTSFGLSSISQESKKYLQNSNAYWRGPVWLNINYLVLRGLRLYYPSKTQVYDNLRNDLLKTVCGQWERTGYFYQNYVNGNGNLNFSYPFNGWTSTIYIISSQNY